MRASRASASHSVLAGRSKRDLRVVAVAAREEGQPLHVVPVQMGQEDACRRRVGRRAGRTPGAARCPHRGGGVGAVGPVGGDRHARGVAAEADVVGSGCGRRSPRPAETGRAPVQSRAWSSRRCPAESSSRCARSTRSASNSATRQGVDGDVARRARAAFEVRPLAQEGAGPVLGQALAVLFDPHDPVEDEQDLGARLPLLHQDGAGREFVDAALAAAPHELGRQRASRARTRPPPRAPRSPRRPRGCACRRTVRYQSLKSVSPDLCESRLSAP